MGWVCLVEPDIPQNTGNIARTCVAGGFGLVLVRPLGFRLTDSLLERAGMDYWRTLRPVILDDRDELSRWLGERRAWLFSAHGRRSHTRAGFSVGDVLVFGSESAGLPPAMIGEVRDPDSVLRIDMAPGVRCLNQASAVAVAVFEMRRQLDC